MNYVQKYIAGLATLAAIDDEISKWAGDLDFPGALHTYLGFTKEEFDRWKNERKNKGTLEKILEDKQERWVSFSALNPGLVFKINNELAYNYSIIKDFGDAFLYGDAFTALENSLTTFNAVASRKVWGRVKELCKEMLDVSQVLNACEQELLRCFNAQNPSTSAMAYHLRVSQISAWTQAILFLKDIIVK